MHGSMNIKYITYLSGRRGQQKLPKNLENIGLTNKHLKSGAKGRTIRSMQIPRTHPLTLGDRMNFLPLTEPNPTNILG